MNNKTSTKDHSHLSPYFSHILRYQKIYLCSLLIIFSGLTLFSNYVHEKPLLVGGESYYFLSSARTELRYHPLTLLFRIIPEQLSFLLPPLISLGTVLLGYALARKKQIAEKKIFFMVLFYLLTPTFLFTAVSISSYSIYLLVVLMGANLMLLEKKKKYLAFIPFLLAAAIDTFSALLLLAGIASYSYLLKKSKEKFTMILLISIAAILIANATLLGAPFFIGPFLLQIKAADFISELGAFSGAGFFSILLALIGIIPNWKKKNLLVIIPALAISVTAYLINTHTVFFLSLLMVMLAAAGFLYLLEQNWKLSFLKNAVVLLLLLGMAFSTVSYVNRLSDYHPTSLDQKALQWIERNTDENAVVLSAPENSYYISYFAQRKPVFALHKNYQDQYDLSEQIFKAEYINELFPLLEKNKVSIIYISEEMKQKLPSQQGFLFLLQNERFKLLYFTNDAEVWSFEAKK